MVSHEQIEEYICQYPVYQYAFFSPEDIEFSHRVRWICQHECERYNTTWACPPAVGTVEECKTRCLSFPHALMMTSVAEVQDTANMAETLATRGPHEALTHQVEQLLRDCGATETYVLSTEACAICEQCAYPGGPCRHRDKMYPCVESHGIVVTDIAERYGIDFLTGCAVVWFSLLFYR